MIPLRFRHVRIWYVGDCVTLQIIRLQIDEIRLLHRLMHIERIGWHAIVMRTGRIHVIQNDLGLLFAIRGDDFEIAGIEIGIVAQQFQVGEYVADVVVGNFLRWLGGWDVHLGIVWVPRVLESIRETRELN